jgi:hypothetical protein
MPFAIDAVGNSWAAWLSEGETARVSATVPLMKVVAQRRKIRASRDTKDS